MTSADFSRFVVTARKKNISPVRPPQLSTHSFHLIPAWFTPSVPNSYWTLFCFANSSTLKSLHIKFLYVRSDVCRRLPSDSTSRWTPLPVAGHFPLLGRVRDLHPLEYVHAGRTKKGVVFLKHSPFPSNSLYAKLLKNENVCRRITKLMLIKFFFLLKSWGDK